MVVFAGRHIPEKRAATIPARDRDRCPASAAPILGDGPERDAVRAEVARLGLGDRVDVPGSWTPTRSPRRWPPRPACCCRPCARATGSWSSRRRGSARRASSSPRRTTRPSSSSTTGSTASSRADGSPEAAGRGDPGGGAAAREHGGVVRPPGTRAVGGRIARRGPRRLPQGQLHPVVVLGVPADLGGLGRGRGVDHAALRPGALEDERPDRLAADAVARQRAARRGGRAAPCAGLRGRRSSRSASSPAGSSRCARASRRACRRS